MAPFEMKTRTQRIWLRSDGIVQCDNLNTDEQTLEDARANIRAVAAVSRGVRRPLYVDTTIASPLSRDAQKLYTSSEVVPIVCAVGIMTRGAFGRVIGNLILVWQRPEVPIQLFENEALATVWLRRFIEKSPPSMRP